MCCAASCAAPCATRRLLGAQRPADVAARAGAGARDGAGLSRTRARRGADRRDAAARGDALPRDAGARPRRSSRTRRATSRQARKLAGETAFKLYDTYGFPLDLTQDALRARGIGVDVDGFDAAMERQRAEARRAWAGSGEAATETRLVRAARTRRRDRISRLRDRAAPRASCTALVQRRRGGRARSAPARRASLILNQTPFYGESGGQVGDTGVMIGAGRARRASPTRRRSSAICSSHDVDGRRRRVSTSARALELQVDHRAPRARSAPTIRRPICCTRRCASCSATMSRRRARWSRPTGCASTSPIRSRSRRRNSRASRTSPTRSCCRTSR